MSPPRRAVADLHCDLLCYLAGGPERTPLDAASRCSLDQLASGGVAFQTFAIFALPQPGSTQHGAAQLELFERMLEAYPDRLRVPRQVSEITAGEVTWAMASVENASALCEEDEPFAACLRRLERFDRRTGGLLYVSLTWNAENRFGGGALARRGLKDDGRRLLDALTERGIAVDLSHASDRLAYDVLRHLEALDAPLPVLASHSNFRVHRGVKRNLPDDIAREIFRRGGVVGMNLLRPFLEPEAPAGLVAAARHALDLGGAPGYVLGADFCYSDDLPPALRQSAPNGYFLEGFGDSSCYPRLLGELRSAGGWPAGFLDAFAWDNALAFIGRVLAARAALS